MRDRGKWRAGAAARSAQAQRAANARWAAVRSALAEDPVRTSRVVELTIRDTHNTMRVVRMQSEPREHGWSRWAVTENGQRVGRRRLGRSTIADLIARSLE